MAEKNKEKRTMKVRFIKNGHIGYMSEDVANNYMKKNKQKIKIMGAVPSLNEREKPPKEESKKDK